MPSELDLVTPARSATPGLRLTGPERRRWRRLAVELERLAAASGTAVVEFGATTVTVRSLDGPLDATVADRADRIAASVPGARIHRTAADEIEVGISPTGPGG